MAETISVRLEISDSKTRDEFERTLAALNGFTVLNSKKPSDLLILEISGDRGQVTGQIERASTSGDAGQVFLTAKSVDPDILIYALRAGIREFFPQPLNQQDVVAALTKIRQNATIMAEKTSPRGKEGKIFTVFGTKGGVGTTTVAVNLATAIARQSEKPSVGLIDMNLLFGEVPIFLNMKPVFDWLEVARNVARLDETYLMSIMQRHASGVHVLPTPIRVVEQFGVSPEVIEKVLSLMQTMFDFIVVDGGQSLGNVSKYIVSVSDKVLLITIPSLPGLINLKKMLDAFYDLGFPKYDTVVVVNRYNQKSGISLSEVREMTKGDVKWSLPNDYRNTMSAINTGEPLTTTALGADITQKIIELAANLTGRGNEKREKKRFFGFS
jgi:pilus assembly protein CpaE